MKHILAIDDDANLLKVIESQLKKLDYSVITAVNGQIGVDLAKQGNPDLILLDIIMPIMDGFKTLSELQKDSSTKNIPVIMLSSKSKKEDVITAMQMGVIDYIVKPHNIDNLNAKISSAFKYKKIREYEEADTQNVKINRDAGRTVVSFKSRLGNPKVLDELRTVFNRGFLNVTSKDAMVIDLRTLDDFAEVEVPILHNILEIFSNRIVYLVTGRHYGVISALVDFDEDKVKMFISSGDLELELSREGL